MKSKTAKWQKIEFEAASWCDYNTGKMIKDQLIVFLLYSKWDYPCDYEKQTVERISRQNKVIAFYPDSGYPLYKILTDKKYLKLFIKQVSSLGSRSVFFPNFHLLPLHRLDPIKIINEKIVLLLLSIFAKLNSGFASKLIWTFSPSSQKILATRQLQSGQDTIIYDCVDYFPGQQEDLLLEFTHIVFANSRTLYNHLRGKHFRVHLVPQGFAAEIFSCPPLAKKHPLLENISSPIIGYIGGLDHRIDWALLKYLADTLPYLNFVFVGNISDQFKPVFSSNIQSIISGFRQNTNVFFIPEVSKDNIPQIIDGFSVCIIPYSIKLDFNLYSFPMKVMEYFSRGKSVISTPILELINYHKFVYICDSPTNWVKAIQRAVKFGGKAQFSTLQGNITSRHSWDQKLKKISYELRKQFVLKHNRIASL